VLNKLAISSERFGSMIVTRLLSILIRDLLFICFQLL
jgi:hypothetical protein